jgi:hypothetical protein
MANIGKMLLPLLLLGTARIADAQSGVQAAPVPEASREPDIVIKGMNQKEQDKAIGGYVDALTDISSSDPIALYEPGIYCPAVFGLRDDRNEEIAARMWRVADTAGIKPAPRPCTASVFVFFVDDIAAFLKTLKARQPVLVGDLLDKDPRLDGGPVLSWQLKRDFDPQHMPLAIKRWGGRTVSSPAGGSRILSMITRAVAASVVIVDRNVLVGLSAAQIGDFAAMRSVVDGDLRLGAARSSSILSVLDGPRDGQRPVSLTAWDAGYLKGRYKGDPRFYGLRQQATIKGAIKREIDAEPPTSLTP